MAKYRVSYQWQIQKAETLWTLWQHTASVLRGQTLTREM
jgi:hypothetical protein